MNAKLTATDSLNADALGNTPASDIINSINDLETSINGLNLATFSEPLVIDYANPVIKMNDNDGSPTDQSINIRANGTNIELPRNGQAIIIEQSSTNVAAENFADLIVTGEIYAGNLDPKLGNKVIHEGNMNNYNFIKTNTQASGSWLDLFAGNTGSQFDLSIGGGRSVLGSTIATLRFVNNYNNNTGILSVNGYGQATWNNNFTVDGVFTELSDVNSKENVIDIQNALNTVTNLRGVKYNKIDTPNNIEIGFIAQEVEVHAPELVETDGNDKKSVAYGRTTALLVEALKEQQIIIDNLTARLETLESKQGI